MHKRARVTSLPISLLSLAMTGSPVSADAGTEPRFARGQPGFEIAQMTIEQRVIIRIPMHRVRPGPPNERPTVDDRSPPPPVRWVEHDGPRCVKIRRLAGAIITSPRGVDLVLRGDDRLRARLGRGCRPADLYSGFYIQPSEDGALCAGRDKVLARSGAECEITELLRLSPDD